MLPEQVNGHRIWKEARDFGLVLTDGRGFFPDGKGENFVRLPFCALTPGEIDEGIQRLARAMEICKRKEGLQ
jgi:2-aminoadipate transaminase